MKIAELKAGQKIVGLLGDKSVSVTAVASIDTDLVELTYRTEDGELRAQYITEDDAARLSIMAEAEATLAFDGDADEWRMAAEALRIKYAALYDPFIAVNSSTIEPLPHQIRAVYEELLPRLPLRFLLADDPGAGKTIMAGLYLKELVLRSDCERALIVVPGGLADQWQEELHEKFSLDFEILTRVMADSSFGKNVFTQHDYLIARMDQLARNEDLQEQLKDARWDLVIVDEAHRMSAHFNSWGGDIKRTKRYELGQLLAQITQNILLMTATPHSGSEEDFQLFMSLLDKDRFEGRHRPETHRTNTEGLMRRMIKEELLTFEGKPLFPERQAHTIPYRLSDDEQELYEEVTSYVRTEMGRAEQIAEAGDKKRGNNIGFALTVLQRRLASSPEAILRTLERRQDRLASRLRDLRQKIEVSRMTEPVLAVSLIDDEDLPRLTFEAIDILDEDLSDEEREFLEEEIDKVTDQATAALTAQELQAEINTLEHLIVMARKVRSSDTDKKWVELRQVLEDQVISGGESQAPHKIIIFTEHKDTLRYLHQKIIATLGRDDAIAIIHGGTRREERKQIQEQFTNNPNTVVLLATDAAGEGLNLQRAHLMVNYDLPRNPNRIEQRFGRIHRIGQKAVCHLWNLLAEQTREGDVYLRLLAKLEQMGKAYDGKVFNVLGEKNAFGNKSLKDLLIEAIRYGDLPEVKAKLDETIDVTVANGLSALMEARALNKEILTQKDLAAIHTRMEQARERRLQPGYVQNFFIPAFTRLGGRIHRREKGRFQITRIPRRLIEAARTFNRWAPLADEYERITFEPSIINLAEPNQPTLIAPGHPLLRAVIELTIADLVPVLRKGTVFIDDTENQSDVPAILYAVEQHVENPSLAYTVSRHFDYIELMHDDAAAVMLTPPYLDYRKCESDELSEVLELVRQPWITDNHEQNVAAWAYKNSLQPKLEELKAFTQFEATRTRIQVEARLQDQINYSYTEHMLLAEQERSGKTGRYTAKQALEDAHSLEERLAKRMHELDLATHLVATPALIRGMAVVIPEKLVKVNELGQPAPFVIDTKITERRAVELVLAAERALGRHSIEQARNNPGYDICSTNNRDEVFFLEVKGRVKGSKEFIITTNEVVFAQTQRERHRLVLVSVDPDDPNNDEVRYIANAFGHIEVSPTTHSLSETWQDYWERGSRPF